MPTPDSRMIDWFRRDPWPRMRRPLIIGPILLSIGGLVVAVSFAERASPAARSASAIVGMLLVGGAVASTLGVMSRILRDDAYVAIRTDAIVLHTASGEEVLPWDEVAGVRWDADRLAVAIDRRAGEPALFGGPFTRMGGPEVAGKLEQARLRAAMGMLDREGA